MNYMYKYKFYVTLLQPIFVVCEIPRPESAFDNRYSTKRKKEKKKYINQFNTNRQMKL